MPPTVGMIFPPWFPPERLLATARAGDDAGVQELWVWEDCFKNSGLAAAAAALASTDRLRLAVGLLPVPLRNVALTAMEIATLERMFPGRFRPVVGHGVQDWMGQVGSRAGSPLTLLSEYVTALDRLLVGEEVSTAGRYVTLDRVRLDWPPPSARRVMVGGVGPRTLHLLGGIAAGVLVDSGTSPARLRAALQTIDAGAAAAGRADRPEIAVYVHAVPGARAGERLAVVAGPATGDPDTEPGLGGDAEDVAAGVRRYLASGAATVVLRPPEDDPDIEGYARWVGREVTPRLG
jgi:alkanesulfonate monooxygenase SsuD/methylene tetrahydromethanopterin reductase-like flavin-dependent oxidoreductase (luciferase family)